MDGVAVAGGLPATEAIAVVIVGGDGGGGGVVVVDGVADGVVDATEPAGRTTAARHCSQCDAVDLSASAAWANACQSNWPEVRNLDANCTQYRHQTAIRTHQHYATATKCPTGHRWDQRRRRRR